MTLPEKQYAVQPDRIIMMMDDDYGPELMEDLSNFAVQTARDIMPKITGALSTTLRPVYGATYWGIYFPDKRSWYLEQGTNPFTMNSLAGKVIPMWVEDPDGLVAREEGPKAKRRVTADGRRQTLIFRRAARKGQRKMAMRNGRMIDVPMSYPGAPGRISNRLRSGRIGVPNVGVRWRHPGIRARHYLNDAMDISAQNFGIMAQDLILVDSATLLIATRS